MLRKLYVEINPTGPRSNVYDVDPDTGVRTLLRGLRSIRISTAVDEVTVVLLEFVGVEITGTVELDEENYETATVGPLITPGNADGRILPTELPDRMLTLDVTGTISTGRIDPIRERRRRHPGFPATIVEDLPPQGTTPGERCYVIPARALFEWNGNLWELVPVEASGISRSADRSET